MKSFRVHRLLGVALALSALLAMNGAAQANSLVPGAPQTAASVFRVPFSAGERAAYQVKLGAVSVGSGSLEVLGMENVDGHSTYHTRMRVSGGVPVARVDDRYESWIDADQMFSRRFLQNLREVNYRRNRTYHFDPARKTFRRENGETGTIASDEPLDDLSFLYFARTLPLRVGDEYSLHRYFKASGNPVLLRVLRKETVQVPAGRFNTVVVQPVIRTDGLFSEGGRAEVYFTDDERHIPVLIKSRVRLVGSLTMLLRTYTAGN
jgi:hypothetical protein